MAIRLPLPIYSVVDASGVPLPGALLYFYTTGTTTPLATYSDNGLSVPNANPVVADANGRFGDIFLQSATYKIVLKTAAGSTLVTVDPVDGTTSLSSLTLTGLLTLTSGQIKFPAAQSASTDPNTLDDYEEGSWTPVDSSGAALSLTVVAADCWYQKIGKYVHVNFIFTFPATADATSSVIGGLPYTNVGNSSCAIANTSGSALSAITLDGTTTMSIHLSTTNAARTNTQLATFQLLGQLRYRTAS